MAESCVSESGAFLGDVGIEKAGLRALSISMLLAFSFMAIWRVCFAVPARLCWDRPRPYQPSIHLVFAFRFEGEFTPSQCPIKVGSGRAQLEVSGRAAHLLPPSSLLEAPAEGRA